MKNKFLKWGQFIVSMALVSSLVIATGCDDDDPEVTPPPSIEVAPSTATGLPGAAVTATVTVEAPAGLSELIILKNGAPFDTEAYDGETEATYDFSYTIEQLPIGSVVNFTFQALDNE